MEREKFEVFNTPTYVYKQYDSVDKLNLRKTGTVYMNEYIGLMGANKRIYSPVSGKIIGTKKVNVDGSLVNALVINNDYKDKCLKIKVGKEIFDNYKRKDANAIFDLFNIDGKFNGKKFLMVDLTIKHNNLENKYLVNRYNYEILETIDAILKIFSIDNAYIAVNNSTIEELLSEYSGIYPNIKYVNSPITNEYSVLYNGYDILKIYNALKFNGFYSTKYLTIINGKNTYVVKTRLGVDIKEILMFLNINANSIEALTYTNNKLSNYDGILTSNIKTITVK